MAALLRAKCEVCLWNFLLPNMDILKRMAEVGATEDELLNWFD